MQPGDRVRGIEIGERPGNAKDPMIPACRETHGVGRFAQKRQSAALGLCDLFQRGGRSLRITAHVGKAKLGVTPALPIATPRTRSPGCMLLKPYPIDLWSKTRGGPPNTRCAAGYAPGAVRGVVEWKQVSAFLCEMHFACKSNDAWTAKCATTRCHKSLAGACSRRRTCATR